MAVPRRVLWWAEKTPDAVAVAFAGGALSYGELAARALGLAGRLAVLGVGAESRVAVCLERTAEMVVVQLGVMLAGGCYVPLDPGLPEERLDYLVSDSGAEVLVTRSALRESVSRREGVAVVCVDEPGSEAEPGE